MHHPAALYTLLLCLLASPLIAEDLNNEPDLLTNVRQLTFEGKRSGEGYFSHDGHWMVFQSERETNNPFYQIYLLDLHTGDTQRISPGHGKTTCAWIHPDKQHVLFASTHDDPKAKPKQQEELDLRASGKQRRYAWDYDEHYDIYSKSLSDGRLTNLTNERGYDAEGSYSPDGQWIAFASNRHAYGTQLSKQDAEMFEHDKSYMMDLYIMKSDGSDIRRLTTSLGYDGGPFFSADGTQLCWRRFSPDGATAEIYTMNTDGTKEQQLTNLGAMSWAPYFHPSGEYLIFTTNKHGFSNFELYLVAADQSSKLVRVTSTDGFDGLPAFSPDGKKLTWTSTRTSSKQSQIFLADWNHQHARKLLGLSAKTGQLALQPQRLPSTAAAIRDEDAREHVEILASEKFGGRLTGTEGEQLATAYVAALYERIGLDTAGDGQSYFQSFEFTAGAALGSNNSLSTTVQGKTQNHAVDVDWRPLAFSSNVTAPATDVVWAGYGIVAPKSETFEAYDSYVHLDVENKWVLALRYMPEEISTEHRQHLSRHASLRYKAMVARDRGAKGLIVVSGPQSKVKNQLVKLGFDASLAGTSLPVISISDALADEILKPANKSLQALQSELDDGSLHMGFVIEGTQLAATTDVQKVRRTGRNVLGRLRSKNSSNTPYIIVGAHIDHLGTGNGGGSLARDQEKGQIHYGADDNASGIAAMLEVAEYLTTEVHSGKLALERDIVFAAWSGEELGLLGSNHFVNALAEGRLDPNDLSGVIAANVNMDMVGRLTSELIVNGTGSSSIWKQEIERRNVPVGLPITTKDDSYLPTDATSFYLKGVPILSVFTGAHEDYHTPRDTPDQLNYDGLVKIAQFVALVTRSLATQQQVPDYIAMTKPEENRPRAGMRAYLGTIPHYGDSPEPGLLLSGVTKGAPADKAGLKGNDIIVSLAGKKIENIYDYTYAIEALKIGQEVEIEVLRDGQRLALKIVPGSRE